MKKIGFTLVELMIVVAIIAFLAMLTLPSFLKYMAKSKRAEAYLNLGAIYAAEKAYWAENDEYTDDLSKLNWKPEGEHVYTYGFPGQSGKTYYPGKSDFGQSLSGSASKTSFTVSAAADIDGDGEPDVITVDEKHSFKIEKDDLA
jgi:type IV pilus assembly protein PilA